LISKAFLQTTINSKFETQTKMSLVNAPAVHSERNYQWCNRGRGGPLWCGGIFDVGDPVDCCHCLTEILYLYWILIECSGTHVTNDKNNFCFICDGIKESATVADGSFVI
jgi:hypothetical protein